MVMYYLIGLGNPGKQYEYTRHNVAWMILDTLFQDEWVHDKYLNAYVHHHMFDETEVMMMKPETFMNHSGEVISGIKKRFSNFESHQLIVVYDDIDLPLGAVRVSFDRGDGGHNGIKSIVEHLGSTEFIRIRVGVSKLIEDGRLIKPNVLGRFVSDEHDLVCGDISSRVGEVLQTIVLKGYQESMNQFN